MLIFMLDSNIFDILVEEKLILALNQLSKEKKLLILTTTLQEEEILAIKDSYVREEAKLLLRLVVPVEDSRIRDSKHWKDDLIALTALREQAILVSQDKQLRERWKSLDSELKLWSFKEFQECPGPFLALLDTK